jgi:Ca-activated chloride channel homolog
MSGYLRRRCMPLLAAIALIISACTAEQPPGLPEGVETGPPTKLRVLAGSELADMEPILKQAAKATGVTVKMDPIGTLEGAETVASGRADGRYDALWFSSTRYMEMAPDAKQRLAGSSRIMGSPVVLGLRGSVARRLGWDASQPTWSGIAEAARHGQFTFAMTDPAASNTGFSALVAVASALDGSGRALDAAAVDRVSEPLTGFFGAQQLTAGSSGWLTDAFVRRNTGADPGPALDGLISYEASLVALNRSGRLPEPLVLVYPKDGVVSADYPLTLLSPASDRQRAAHRRLTGYLRTSDVQRTIADRTARRPARPGVPIPRGLPRGLVEIPFPDRPTVIERLLFSYFDRFRRPSSTVYVLDVSGSMAGNRLATLKQALSSLTRADTPLSGRYCRFRSREEVTLLPFSDAPHDPLTITVDERDPERSRASIRAAIDGLRAKGNTAIYDSLISAYKLLDKTSGHDRFISIVLMTDGKNNKPKRLEHFQKFLDSRSGSAPVRVFPILFGEAAESEMREVAAATKGEVWDAKNGDLARAFCQIRGYQ